jgi:hypothetical protein
MHDSERNRLLKRQRMVGLAASDMSEAQSAARALRTMKPIDIPTKRVLETGLIVSYSRSFTKSSIVTLLRDEYAPADEALANLHYRILELRDSRCAHTDKDADRQIAVQYGPDGSVGSAETFGPVLSPDEVELAHELFEVQRQRLLEEAITIDEELGSA